MRGLVQVVKALTPQRRSSFRIRCFFW